MASDKKDRIMAAAEALFRTGQYQEITLDEVALAADVGKGTIYEHFRSKDDLFFQTAIAAFDQMCDLVRRKTAADAPVQRHLERALQAVFNFVRQRRTLFRLIQAEGQRAQGRGGGLRQRWNQHRRKLTEAMADILRRGVTRGEIRKDVPPEVAADYLLGMIRTSFNELEERPADERGWRMLLSVFLQGVREGDLRGGRRG